MTQVVAKLQDLLELQKKCGNSADSPGTISGFSWMIRRYRGSATNQNSDHVGTSRSSGANMNHCNQLSTIGDADGLQEMPHQWTTVPTEDPKEFTYDELKYAARGFGYETCLAEWRYGKIYKGWLNEMTYSPSVLDNGLAISIKIFQRDHKKCLDNSELELVLTYLRHPNVVKLIGYCLEGVDPCLCRLKIAIGAGRGLDYLHAGFGTQLRGVIHRDVKSSNILLDENWAAMISDF
ncbi:serine/threonine/dual specificity protein kinase, catalytic domain-containing protein, partial [Tanacetum coccineum]